MKNKTVLYMSFVLANNIILWVLIDKSWLDIWAFNKEIIMTSIAIAVPVAIVWSVVDNLVDRLFVGTKMESWLKKLFT